VILTRFAPTRTRGRIALPGAGHFIFHVGRKEGPFAAEVSSPGASTRLSLGTGRYFVRWREAGSLVTDQTVGTPLWRTR